ncbi:hypothetical protein ABZ490_22820 [Streptomyces sp. NPDC005811]|uniref:hypothetical protein n=1 Tax=Streptomyces sp. NPDC005811 TaxID=3154565 RepID=UPI00340BFBFD
MRPLSPPPSAAPASGVLRGLRAGVLAVLCVLLPLAGHALTRGHAPRWAVVAAMALVAVPAGLALTRRRLTDGQLIGVLGAAQLACHTVYSLPGVCAAVPSGGNGFDAVSRLVRHDAVAGPPTGVLLTGHLVTLLLTVRLLGVTERLLWQSKPLLATVRRLLVFLWPLLGRAHGTGPQITAVESTSPPRSAALVRINEGRAPPRRAHGTFVLLRPMPVGGPCLP